MTLEEIQEAVTGTLVEDCDEDIWCKLSGGTWHILDSYGSPTPIGHSSRFLWDREGGCGPIKYIGMSSKKLRNPNEPVVTMPGKPVLPEPATLPGSVKLPVDLVLPSQAPKTAPVSLEVASRGLHFSSKKEKPLCGAEDYGYQLDPDQEPTKLGPCVLPAGHYPATMHEAPQTHPEHPDMDVPNVKWGAAGGFHKVVQGQIGAFGDTSPKYLHELVPEGRYFIDVKTNWEEFTNEVVYGCNNCSNDVVVKFPADLDAVTLLKWIEDHEAEFHSKEDCHGNG